MTICELMQRRAPLPPRTLNVDQRTVEVTFSTGAPVRRRDMDGPYIERLSLDPAAVNLSRLRGAPVLDNHQRDSLGQVLGVVESAHVDGREGRAVLRISQRADPILQDIGAGILRHVSIGYSVEEWRDSTDPETGQRVRTAVNWTPQEVSFVPLPADAGATVRSEKESSMEPETTSASTDTPPPASDRADADAEIRRSARLVGLDDGFANSLITRGATVEEARAAVFDELTRRAGGSLQTQQPKAEIVTSHDDPESRCQRMAEALYARTNPAHELSEPARQYAGLTLPDIARETLRQRGISTSGLSPSALITRSLHSTSDFSLILGDTVGRSLRAAYQGATAGIKQLGRKTTAADFRAKHRIMLGAAPTLEKVGEHGEFKSGTLAEAKESYRIDTFGRIIGITRQALVNDDLGAFTDLSRRLGIAAADFEADFLVKLLETASGAGPTMEDTNPLFHASHGNLADSGAAPGETTLSAARLAMRQQTGLSGQRINVVPRTLLVPAELETASEKLLSAIQATKTADVNPFASLGLVVESRLSDAARWYLHADNVDGLEYAYLEGAEGPQIESRNGFEIDGVQIRIRLDFGAGFVDWRGWYQNPGQ